MNHKKTNPQAHPAVIKVVELTDNFEQELFDLINSAVNLSQEDKNEIAAELESSVQNIDFMLKFFSSVKPKKT